jgi:predicted Zn-dependent protease
MKPECVMKLLLTSAMLLSLAVQAQDFSRSALSDQREVPSYVLGAVQERWTAGQVNWYYNPANQPANLATADVINAINTAAARWNGMCNLAFTYMGTTTAVPNVRSTSDTIDRINVFGWGQLTNEMAVYGAYTKWWYNGSHALIDADIVINTANGWTIQNVEAIMTHELGHAIGLDHSNVAASVMFANPYNSYSYQRTLRGDDASACSALYGASANADSNRALNWAEQTFPQYFSPSPAASGTYDGYYYRYYPSTHFYVGTKNGVAYMMGPDNVIREQGTLTNFSNLVHEAGF